MSNEQLHNSVEPALEQETIGQEVMLAVIKNPDLMKVEGWRDIAFDAAKSAHRDLLVREGVSVTDANRVIEGIEEDIAERNGRLEYIERTAINVGMIEPEAKTNNQDITPLTSGKEVILDITK